MSDTTEDLKEGQQLESEQDKKDKISKNHAAALDFVKTLLGGDEALLPRKSLGTEGTANVVALLFKDEQEEFEKKALEELKTLLKKYFLFMDEMSKAKKELEQKEQQKKKEFTEAVNNFKKTISERDVRNEGYAEALKSAKEELAKDKE
jgi:hypothetical protein